ncbi:MAG: elongation factor G [Gammaproteobacteria bacterium]|nr:elongation factor G [Gammaproteobacteria bacterium]MDE0246570.1 elongation factor G [Gammaproteobacteria bacterium]
MTVAREYPTDRIRNVAVLGHANSGKTTLVDALCFTAGTASRKGNVAEGHALTLTSAEELAQGVSMQLTGAFAEWDGHKINLLDTPGYLDFTGEALAAVHAADAAIVVVGATSGVEVGTEKVWEYCEQRGLPRLVVVSMMDKEHADFMGVLEAVRERLAPHAMPIQLPVGTGESFSGAVEMLDGSAHGFLGGDGKGEVDAADVPADISGTVEEWHTELQETLATLDEELLDLYLEEGEIPLDEAIRALALAVRTNEIVPVVPLAASSGAGTRALLDRIIALVPGPADAIPQTASREGEDPVELRASDDGPFTALVFKTVSEPHVGNLSLFRVCSGSVRNGAHVSNAVRGSQEKLNHLSVPLGKERPEVAVLHAGDIGVVAKLRGTHTNDTLAEQGRDLAVEGIGFPLPDVRLAVRGRSRSDDDKLGEALASLQREDPCFKSGYEPELRQTIIRGMGELHLDVQIARMSRKHGVQVDTERPRIAYRETVTRRAEAHGRHKKQSGGRGQFGDCRIRLEPLAPGGGYEFVDAIKGGVIPGRFIPSVDRGIRDTAGKGILAGYPVVDFRAECYDGTYHSVDSSDIAFQLAGAIAFRKAAEAARPTILEPIMEVEVTTPEAYMGDVMADASQRRGKVQGIDSMGGRTVIRARIPQAELYKYAAALRAMTHGRAHHVRELVAYEPVPEFEKARIIAEANEED